MKIQTVTLPAHYASAIINNDYSGLDDSEIKQLNNELLNNDVLFSDCLDNGDEYTGRYNGLITNLIDYKFKKVGN